MQRFQSRCGGEIVESPKRGLSALRSCQNPPPSFPRKCGREVCALEFRGIRGSITWKEGGDRQQDGAWRQEPNRESVPALVKLLFSAVRPELRLT